VISGGFLSTCVGQEEKSLFIVLYPHDSASETPLEENMVYEGTQYDVIVGYNHSFDDNSSDVGIANNVTVTVPWEVPYFINSFPPYITITIPQSWPGDSFIINASKEGYTTVEQLYLISEGKLMISLDHQTIQENKEITVAIRDQNNVLVQGVTVYINGYEQSGQITDIMGNVLLMTPDVDADQDFSVIAYKNRFSGDSVKITILNTVSAATYTQIMPILLSALVVICAIIYVGIRKKRAIKLAGDIPPREVDGMKNVFTDDKEDVFLLSKRTGKMQTHDASRPPSVVERGPRVEEIRIHQSQVKKEVESLTEEKDQIKTSPAQNKQDDEWFKGTDYMRYKIDEITGKIDGEKDGKWFEGVGDMQSKVDEKLKQRSKKKTNNEEK